MSREREQAEKKRGQAQEYVKLQEQNNRNLREKMERDQKEVRDHQVEGIQRHLYDSMTPQERRDAFGKSHH